MPDSSAEPLFTTQDVTLAVKAIGQFVGGFRVRWWDKPFEGWEASLEQDSECICDAPKGCYCCDPCSVTREQVEALRRVGVEVRDA